MKIERNTDTEQMILETAERLFLEKGFSMTSTTEIAKQVGCNQALVHYYFRTKEKLFEAIFIKKTTMFVSPLLQSYDLSVSFEERLKKLIEAHFDLIRANPNVPFLFFNELLTNPSRVNSLKKQATGIYRMALAKIDTDLNLEIQKGTIRPMRTIDLLLTIFSLNVTLFLGLPILKNAVDFSEEELTTLIENRKRENVIIILRALKP